MSRRLRRRRRKCITTRSTTRSATSSTAASGSKATAGASAAAKSASKPTANSKTERPAIAVRRTACFARLWAGHFYFCTCASTSLFLHVREHVGRRPAVDLEPILLLIGAERRAGQHAGLAVDLVLIHAERGQLVLHGLDLRGLELRTLHPGMLERLAAGDAVAQVADEQHVE